MLYVLALDDNFMDDMLGDGIHGQDINDNDCYKEIQSQLDLKVAAQKAKVNFVSVDEVIIALLCDNSELIDEEKKQVMKYQVSIDY